MFSVVWGISAVFVVYVIRFWVVVVCDVSYFVGVMMLMKLLCWTMVILLVVSCVTFVVSSEVRWVLWFGGWMMWLCSVFGR